MNAIPKRFLRSHDDVLEAIARELDIPDHLDNLARSRYRSLGDWLDRPDSSLKVFRPEISPQGSFLFGTVIRPVGDADHYDIDLVCCLLRAMKKDFTMQELKEAVGAEIRDYARCHGMKNKPEDNRRCWTLLYADGAQFHMDILPSIPDRAAYQAMLIRAGHAVLANDQALVARAIAITDKTHPRYRVVCEDWPLSNPQGFAAWFHSRQREALTVAKRRLMAESRIYASVEDVPDYKVKTPLQRAVQLLKRHRDVMFAQAREHKPISVIITTLAARAYRGESTISETLRTILRDMEHYIEDRDGVAWIENPVNPQENFADKWPDHPAKKENFFAWMRKARRDFGLYQASSFSSIPDELADALSPKTVERILPLIVLATPAILATKSSAAAEAEVEKIKSEGTATKPWAK